MDLFVAVLFCRTKREKAEMFRTVPRFGYGEWQQIQFVSSSPG